MLFLSVFVVVLVSREGGETPNGLLERLLIAFFKYYNLSTARSKRIVRHLVHLHPTILKYLDQLCLGRNG